jgi:hypothetical protein
VADIVSENMNVVAAHLRAFDIRHHTGCAASTCKPVRSIRAPLPGGDVVPAVGGDVLYSANRTSIDAYDATGASGCDHSTDRCAELWTTTPQPLDPSAIEVAGGIVYTTSQNDGYVHAFALAG